ncbi:glycosyltransferase [Roseococcus sp. SYP-B2431]|uniref:glycosyltransferase n=1 Tax=Roseococcus sp. SYP-B2431 TaxID=2496640 RepID=UPI0013F46D8B|nr:glycosyltransferase [Roseococcus sp. SYP-B2431]
MSRFARRRQVFFLEEPAHSDAESLRIRPCAVTGVQVVTPMMRTDSPEGRRAVLDLLLARSGSSVAWYAAPEAHAFSGHVPWLATVYDCAGEPSAEGRHFEAGLMQTADLVFTGGLGLHDERRHPNIHFFPDGIDVEHLETARAGLPEPEDQIGLGRPLIGRFGAVDDRLDLDLLAGIAALRPNWHFSMIGPIATSRDLPRAANIHWLGARDEAELPAYLSHWDVAIMPLARGALPEAAEVPRYLAAGLRVVTTPQREISRRFRLEAVMTAGTAGEIVAAAEQAMLRADVSDFVAADDLLATLSWDSIQEHMAALLTMAERNAAFRPASMSRFGAMARSTGAGEAVLAG